MGSMERIRFFGFVQVAPVVLGVQFGVMTVAAACPEGIQRLVVGGPPWMIGRALHGAERAPVEASQRMRMGLALGKETHTQTAPAPGR